MVAKKMAHPAFDADIYDHANNATVGYPNRVVDDLDADAVARARDEDKREAHQVYVEELWDRLLAVGGWTAIEEACESAGIGLGFAWGCLNRGELTALRIAIRIRLMDY